jgi:hypothetical protein
VRAQVCRRGHLVSAPCSGVWQGVGVDGWVKAAAAVVRRRGFGCGGCHRPSGESRAAATHSRRACAPGRPAGLLAGCWCAAAADWLWLTAVRAGRQRSSACGGWRVCARVCVCVCCGSWCCA